MFLACKDIYFFADMRQIDNFLYRGDFFTRKVLCIVCLAMCGLVTALRHSGS